MKRFILFFVWIFVFAFLRSQCPSCGNWINDAGETNINCPQDIPQPATCTSCASIGTFDPLTCPQNIPNLFLLSFSFSD